MGVLIILFLFTLANAAAIHLAKQGKTVVAIYTFFIQILTLLAWLGLPQSSADGCQVFPGLKGVMKALRVVIGGPT